MNKDFEARHNETLRILVLLTNEAVRSNETLVFLGGSAVQAILRNPKRLSIDLDVYYSGDPAKLIAVLEKEGYKNTKRNSHNPEMFEFHTARKGNVMVKMDFLRVPVPKEYILKKDIVTPGDNTAAVVYIGKPEYLIASKISALAVGTIGRRAESATIEIDVIKDVFDLNSLFDEFPEAHENLTSIFHEIVDQQNKLRKTRYTADEAYLSLEKTLKEVARFGKSKPFITQGALQNFSQYLYEGILGRTKLGEFRLGATGALNRTDLTTMALRTLYYVAAIQHKIDVRNGDETAKQKERDRNYVSTCEKELITIGEDPAMLHELKIMAPKALIYFYLSKSQVTKPT